MNHRLGAAPLGLLLLLMVASTTCDRQPSAPVAQASTTTPGNLGQKSPDLSEEIKKLQTDLSALGAKVSLLESSNASVSTEEETYGIAKTQFGVFTIKSRGVTPYLDGFKVKLSIGNLTTGTFHGFKVKVAWTESDRPSNSLPPIPTGYVLTRDRTFDLTDELRPGAYSEVEVALTPAKPEEIKTLWVGLELNQVALRGR